ncbi:MAG: iron-containing alcohol dehydrogenase [Gudongella sp.]|nr:iron-containing alcohol dehydrogenase [Gudongella sp.]
MIERFDFILPTKIRYGAGAINLLGQELRNSQAKKIMIITDRGIVKAGLLSKLEDILNYENLDYIIFDEIEANPKDHNVEKCAKVARENDVDTFLAFGGGSPMDAAKGAAVIARQGGRIKDYQGKDKIGKNCMPLITIPTTAGTGSEVTFSSVITDSERNFKFTVKSPYIAARTAILDPELTISVPPLITASTGIDALTHAIEGYTANCTEPIAEAIGLYAVEYIASSISRAVGNGNDLEARDRMMMGSLMGGLSFSHSDVASVHCMAEALGSFYDAPHGLCNSILLPYVMEYNLPECEYKYARIARAMGIDENDDRRAAEKGIKHIKKLSEEIGLPGLSSLEIDSDDFEKLAEMSVENGSNASNPKKMNKETYIELFIKAYEDRR